MFLHVETLRNFFKAHVIIKVLQDQGQVAFLFSNYCDFSSCHLEGHSKKLGLKRD